MNLPLKQALSLQNLTFSGWGNVRFSTSLQILIILLACVPFGSFGAVPSWSVNPNNFTNSMTVIGSLDVSAVSLTSNDQLAAFANGECCGVTKPTYIPSLNKYYFYLTVFSSESTAKPITFKLYDAETDAVTNLYGDLAFTSNKSVGSLSNPYIFSDKAQPNIISFSFAENIYQNTVIDAIHNTIVVSLSEPVTNFTFTPAFELSTGATIKTGNSALQSGISTLNFSKPLTVTVVSATGQENIWTVLLDLKSYTVYTDQLPENSGNVNGVGVFYDQADVTLSAVPELGYGFKNWTENNVVVSTDYNYTFKVGANRSLVANFVLNQYTVNVVVNQEQGTVLGAKKYNFGEEVTLTAKANAGYHLVNWTENNLTVSTSETYTFKAAAARTLVANFEPNLVSISSGSANFSDINCTTCDVAVVNDAELVINKSKTVKSVTVAPTARLSLTTGQTLITTNGITLQSDQNGTATLVDTTTTAGAQSITGTVQQYVTAGRNWYLCIPLSQAPSSVLNRGTSVVCFNEPTDEWLAPAQATLQPMRGYIQVAQSTPTVTGSTGTLDFSGTFNTGHQSVNLTRSAGKSGFNLVGNPYPSYLNWNLVNKTNVGNTMWLRTKVGNSYKFYTFIANKDGGMGSPASVTGFIPPMQAFWVRVSNQGAGSISVENNMRSHKDVAENSIKANEQTKQKSLRLQVSNGINTDETVIYYNANASDELDDYDAPKRSNGDPDTPEIFTQAGTEQLVINGMCNLKYDTGIPLGFSSGKPNNFSITCTEMLNFDLGTRLFLKDNELNTTVDLTNKTSYNFSSPATAPSINRFALIFEKLSINHQVANTLNASCYVNALGQITINAPINSTYTIYNAMGQEINAGVTSANNITVNQPFNDGLYIVKIKKDEKIFTTKLILN